MLSYKRTDGPQLPSPKTCEINRALDDVDVFKTTSCRTLEQQLKINRGDPSHNKTAAYNMFVKIPFLTKPVGAQAPRPVLRMRDKRPQSSSQKWLQNMAKHGSLVHQDKAINLHV